MYNFSKKQKIAIGIILAVLAIIVVSYVYSRGTEASTNDEILEENIMQEKDQVEPDSSDSTTEDQIIVHVAGAVNQEGIVYLKEGARINEAIEKAGGTTEEADMSQVNLAYELEDGMKIYIPKKGEVMDENADQDYLVKFSSTTDTAGASSARNIK